MNIFSPPDNSGNVANLQLMYMGVKYRKRPRLRHARMNLVLIKRGRLPYIRLKNRKTLCPGEILKLACIILLNHISFASLRLCGYIMIRGENRYKRCARN